MLDSISFIGGGVMAEAMIQGLLAKGLVPADHVTTSDPRKKRQEELHHLCGIRVTGDNVLAAKAGEIVVFAVKPQVLGNVLQELKGALEPRQMVMSIVAGARIDTMRETLCHDAIVRVMPNTPSQIGQGISVWTATEGFSQERLDQAGPFCRPWAKKSMWTTRSSWTWPPRSAARDRCTSFLSWRP